MSAAELSGRARQAAEALRNNEPEKALEFASAACSAEPDNYEPHQLAGIAALSLGSNESAQEYFGRACRLARDPQREAASWTGLGEALLSLGDAKRATNAFQRALSLAPGIMAAHAGLAECMRLNGQGNLALDIIRKVVETTPQNANAQVTYGMLLTDREEYDAAARAFNTALRLRPEHGPARLGLARLARFMGREKEAASAIEEVLGSRPEYSAYLGLVMSRRISADDPLIDRLEARRREVEGSAATHARKDILFALAKTYDDIGQYDKASECLLEANRVHRESVTYDVAGDERLIANVERFFTAERMRELGDSARDDIKVICIASLPRSGSTLTEQMLASHSQVNGGGELTHLREVVADLNTRWGAHPAFPDLPPDEARLDLREMAERYAKATARLRLITPWSTDKNMINFLYLGLVKMMLPGARIVHVRRHPLANALGLFRQNFVNGMTYSYDLDDIVRYYRAYDHLMQHWRTVLPEGFTEVFYEALVADPEPQLRRILDHIGLAFEPACLEFYKLERPVSTASTIQVRQPLNRSGIDRHEHYGELLAPVAEALAPEIRAYEAELEATLAKTGA